MSERSRYSTLLICTPLCSDAIVPSTYINSSIPVARKSPMHVAMSLSENIRAPESSPPLRHAPNTCAASDTASTTATAAGSSAAIRQSVYIILQM